MARRKTTATPRPERFLRAGEYENLNNSVSFRVTGDSGWYHFIALVTDPDTGEQWVDGYGGEGRGQFATAGYRSFHLHRLRRRGSKIITRPFNTGEYKTSDDNKEQ